MVSLKEAVEKKLKLALKPKTRKDDPVFDTFSSPVEFGARVKDIQWATFSGPIKFGKRVKSSEKLDEQILGKTPDYDSDEEEDTVNDLHDKLHSHYVNFAEEHKSHINSYTCDSSDINDKLHKQFKEGKEIDHPDDKRRVSTLDDAMHCHKTPHALTVYSGVPESPHHIIKAQGGYEKGKGAHVILPAYTSTSISSKAAENFARVDNDANKELEKKDKKKGLTTFHQIFDRKWYKHMLKIHVPKGHHGAYVARYSNMEHEKEFMLPRNTKLHIHHEPEYDHKHGIVYWHSHIVDEHGNKIKDK